MSFTIRLPQPRRLTLLEWADDKTRLRKCFEWDFLLTEPLTVETPKRYLMSGGQEVLAARIPRHLSVPAAGQYVLIDETIAPFLEENPHTPAHMVI